MKNSAKHKIKISQDFCNYLTDVKIHNAVNFIIESTDKTWMPIAQKELGGDYKDTKSYAESWLYACKVQADFYNFMRQIWELSWGPKLEVISLTPIKFRDVETLWEKDNWLRTYSIYAPKNKKKYNQLTAGLEIDTNISEGGKYTLRIWVQFGDGEDDYCEVLEKKIGTPDGWKLEKEGGEYFFCIDRKMSFSSTEIKFASWEMDMQAMSDYITSHLTK